MKKINFICLIGLTGFLSGGTVFAQHHKTFSEQPAKRQAAVKHARENAIREKREAREWAKARGLKMRYDNGKQLHELMAVRNGRPVYYSTKNVNAAISTAANRIRKIAPYNLDGNNILIGVWDGGSVLSTHVEFSGGRIVVSDGSPSHYHATHVGGTLAAHGENPLVLGMAPNSKIASYDWDRDVSEMTSRAASAPGQSTKLYLSNHSYGYGTGWEWDKETQAYYWFGDGWASSAIEPYFGQYVAEARDWDQIVYNAPYFLPFKAAGNDRNDNPSAGDTVHEGFNGPARIYNPLNHPKGDGVYNNGFDTINPVGTAKNIMTVGAVNDAVSGMSRSLANATMSSFSSWGPADDGRIKPDIVANGIGVYSCDNDNNSDYLSASGTSMASPNACGSAALLVEYYKELFSGGAMRASSLKGLIIHTADDLGRPGPDYEYGWGLMNTLAAAELLTDSSINSIRLTEAMITSSQRSNSFTFFSDGIESVRVTLCWSDPPGYSVNTHNNRNSRLINDLDLSVVGPGGTYSPYKLDYTHPSANATTGKNNIDNVEQVYIAASAIGEYTVTVDFDGVSVSGEEQWYSLLISGSGSDSDGDGMSNAWETRYFGGATNAVASADSDGDGKDNLSEYITGYNPIDPASAFKVLFSKIPETGNTPTIITWNPIEGRIYNISWSPNLIIKPFTPLPSGADLPYTQNSYTDQVERVEQKNFYRINVQFDR